MGHDENSFDAEVTGGASAARAVQMFGGLIEGGGELLPTEPHAHSDIHRQLTSIELPGDKEKTKEQKEEAKKVEEAWKTTYETIESKGTGAFGKLFAEIVAGNEEKVAAVMKSLGKQYVAEGTGELLKAGIRALIGDPRAPAQAVAASALIAFGASLAGGGAAVGGGGSSSSSAASGAVTPGGGGAFGGGGVAMPMTINVYSLNPTEEVGMLVGQSVEMAHRRRGDVATKPFQRGSK